MEHPDADESARRITELLDRRRTDPARELLKEAIGRHPNDSRLMVQAARADMQDSDNLSARATLARLMASEPGHVGARLLMLSILIDDNELPAAEELALALLREFPASADLYAAYGRIMLAALQLPKARALGNEALRLDPDSEMALRVLALCDIVERPSGSDSDALRRLLAENPEDQDTLALMVTALVHRREYAAALRGAQELLRMQPDNPAWVNLVRELRYDRHWSMRPLWPLQRFGWTGSVALWVGFLIGSRVVAAVLPDWAAAINLVFLAYVIYSWVWPSLLRRILRD